MPQWQKKYFPGKQTNKQTSCIWDKGNPAIASLLLNGMLESAVIGNNQGQLLAVGSGSTQEPAEKSTLLGSAPCILTPELGRCCPNSPFKQAFR